MELSKEEYFDRCRVVLRVLDSCRLDDEDRATLVWMALEYLEKLGEVSGIGPSILS